MRYAGPSPQGRFPPPVARWAAVCAACLLAGVASAALSPRQVRDQLKRFQPAAARLAVEDLKNAPGYDYAARRAAGLADGHVEGGRRTAGGNRSTRPCHDADARPERGYPGEIVRVATVARPFWIGEMEVMNAQYHAFDPAHDSRHQDQYGFDQVAPGHVGNHRRQPVVRVSRVEAEAFCAWLSARCGVKARLPTEEEWEWAARAGTATPFPWGGVDDDFGRWANLADRDVRFMYATWDLAAAVQQRRPYPPELNYPLHEERWTDDWFTLNFVGRANANPWGLYDMHGNAARSCAAAALRRAPRTPPAPSASAICPGRRYSMSASASSSKSELAVPACPVVRQIRTAPV